MSVKNNIIANFVGRVWSGVLALIFIPLYIKFIGIEAYGLIGIYASLLVLFSVLDMGLSTTLNRELSRLSTLKDKYQEARDLVRTFEMIYWCVGIIISVVLIVSAPVIAHHWLNAQGLSVKTVTVALRIMGGLIAFQWPIALYSGGLMGLQRQVLLNVVRIIAATLQGCGVILVLWLISPTIYAYFIWQIIITAFLVLTLAVCLWISLPKATGQAHFRKQVLINNWKFATGLLGITLLTTVLTQLDKLVISKMLTLKVFGYYALATTVAGILQYIANPLFSALFPRFSQLVAEKKEEDLITLYHKGCQFLYIMVIPLWIVVALFSKELMSFWIRDPSTVERSYFLVSLIITGTAFNAIMLLPFALQLAYGWTKLSFYKNVFAVIIFIPLLILLVTNYGAAGAAIAWIALNIGYFLFEIPIMHSRLLRNEMWRWYFVDVGLPLLSCLFIGILGRIFMPDNMSVFFILVWIFIVLILSMSFSALVMPFVSEWLRRMYNSIMFHISRGIRES